MRKIFLAAVMLSVSIGASAQAVKNQFGVGPELGLSTGSGGGTFFGGTAKLMYGAGKAGQITLTSGYLVHSETTSGIKIKASEIPILLGYRHYFNGLFVEPQAGYMSDHAEATASSPGYFFTSTMNAGSFGYGIGGGYAFTNGIDLGASFRNTTKAGSEGLIIFRVAYNLSLSGK